MKFNKFFMGVLGAMAFTACSSDEPINKPGTTPDVNLSDSYVSVSILMPTSVGGRAVGEGDNDDDKFETGTAAESAVSNVVFFFFDDQDNCVHIEKVDDMKFENPAKPSTNPNIENYGTAEVRLKTGLVYSQVAVALNSKADIATDLSNSINTVSDLLKRNDNYISNLSAKAIKKDNETVTDFGKGQMMSNSVYYETDRAEDQPTSDQKVVLVPITSDNIYTSSEKGQLGTTKKYVEIYVERAAVRVDVTEANFNMDNYYISKNGNEEVDYIILYDLNDMNVKEKIYVRPFPLGTCLNVLAPTAKLIKEIRSDFGYGQPSNPSGDFINFQWNDPKNKRSYWANTTLETGSVMKYLSWNDAVAQGPSGFKQYINPNTQAFRPIPANEGSSLNTKVMVVAELYQTNENGEKINGADTKPLDLIRYGADYMLPNTLRAYVASQVNNAILNIDWANAKYTTKNDAEENVTIELNLNEAEIKAVNVVVSNTKGLEGKDFDFALQDNDNGNKAPDSHDWISQIVKSDEFEYEIPQSVTVNTIVTTLEDDVYKNVKAVVAQTIADQLEVANKPMTLYWKGGKTYFYYNIRHQGFYGLVGNGESDFLYGTVRNHIYKVNLNGIYGLGTPVVEPGKPINPDRPEEVPPSFISAKINILKWRVVTNNATIH